MAQLALLDIDNNLKQLMLLLRNVAPLHHFRSEICHLFMPLLMNSPTYFRNKFRPNAPAAVRLSHAFHLSTWVIFILQLNKQARWLYFTPSNSKSYIASIAANELVGDVESSQLAVFDIKYEVVVNTWGRPFSFNLKDDHAVVVTGCEHVQARMRRQHPETIVVVSV